MVSGAMVDVHANLVDRSGMGQSAWLPSFSSVVWNEGNEGNKELCKSLPHTGGPTSLRRCPPPARLHLFFLRSHLANELDAHGLSDVDGMAGGTKFPRFRINAERDDVVAVLAFH